LLYKDELKKKLTHDMDNHLVCIDHLLHIENFSEAREYVTGIRTGFQKTKPDIETGNEVLNAIVYDLTDRFADVSFALEWSGFFPEKTRISSADICIVFSNALINAIEAVQKINTAEKKNIKVYIKTVGGNLYIAICNPCAEPVTIRNNRLVTNKNDKAYHGFGTRNILECTAKYRGEVTFSYNDGVFSVELIFYDVVIGNAETGNGQL